MNKISYLLCLLLVHGTCISQSTSSLVGKWTLFCFSDDDVYFNLKTDSFSISDELKQSYPEPEKQKQMVAIHANIWGKMQYHFRNDGTYRSFLFNDTLAIEEGRYREDKKLGVIERDFRGDDGVLRTEKIGYQIKEQSLYLKMAWSDPPVLLIFERKKND